MSFTGYQVRMHRAGTRAKLLSLLVGGQTGVQEHLLLLDGPVASNRSADVGRYFIPACLAPVKSLVLP